MVRGCGAEFSDRDAEFSDPGAEFSLRPSLITALSKPGFLESLTAKRVLLTRRSVSCFFSCQINPNHSSRQSRGDSTLSSPLESRRPVLISKKGREGNTNSQHSLSPEPWLVLVFSHQIKSNFPFPSLFCYQDILVDKDCHCPDTLPDMLIKTGRCLLRISLQTQTATISVTTHPTFMTV